MLLLVALLVGSTSVWAAEPDVTLDFTKTTNWNIPTSGKSNKDLAPFTDGTYTIKLYSTTNYKMNDGYLILGKQNSYLELPAFNFNVEKIEVVGRSGASGSVVQNIYVGETAVSNATTGATGTNTYNINSSYQAAGNIYTLKITSDHNTQITYIKIYAASAKSNPTITPTSGSVRVGKTLDVSTLFDSNSTGAFTYSITAGDSYASLVGSTLTGIAEGNVTVQASQAAAGNYNAGSATTTVTVNPALVLSSIAVTTPPTKITYTEGETFDPTGIVVTATYNDASTDDVTASCTYSPDGELETTDTEITISYIENAETKTTTQAITVNEKPTYEVTYHVGLETNVVNRKQGTTLSIDTPSDSHGYTFQGWSSTESTESPVFVDNSTVVNNNMELWAIFGKTVGDMYYKKVTTTAGITDGEYLIVYEGTDENHSGADAFKGSLETLDGEYNGTTVTIDNDNKIASTETLNANTFIIDVTNKTLKSKSGHYIGINSYGNGLKQSDDADTYTHTYLGIDENGNAEIGITFSGGNMDLRYNKSSNQLRFRYYKDKGQAPIALYKQTYDIEYSLEQYEAVTISAAKYATFASDYDLDFSGVDGLYAYTAAEDANEIAFTKVTSSVKAGEGLLLYANVNASTVFYVPVATDSPEAVDGNRLVRGTGAFVASEGTHSGEYNYVLSTNGEGEVNFYRAAGKKVGTDKAYLKDISATATSKFFLPTGDEEGEETDGIKSVQGSRFTVNGEAYNLAGQRVGKDYKGIVIVNGKKMLNK